MTTKREEAVERMKQALPYFRHAISEAAKSGDVKLGVLSYAPDGSGQIISSFECAEFFEDIALIIGAAPQTEEDTLQAKAVQFLQKFGIRRG